MHPFRSAAASTEEALAIPQIRTIVIIAEGVPERRTKLLTAKSKALGKVIIGPATVGGVKAGCFKIGNAGGTIENIIESKLHRPGSVGFVSKSGGLSNEAYNIIARNTDGLYEGIAIGGDTYPGSTLLEHLLRFENIPEIKMLVCLGEVGGNAEYEIAEALKNKKITKPLVIWVTGTCSKAFKTEVQFGHAGAKAGCEVETADAKNAALRAAGAIVPNSYDDYDQKIKATYESLVKAGHHQAKARTPSAEDSDGLRQGAERRTHQEAFQLYLHNIRRPRRRTALRQDAYFRGLQERHRNRRSTQHPLVQTPVSGICDQIHRNDHHGHGRSWTCSFGRP